MEQAFEIEKLIESYKNGESLNAIARAFGTNPATISHLLKKHGVELRHDNYKNGEYYVQNGERLIEWAKAQKRPVTKMELASLVGTKRLSPSYFLKYPELGQYVERREQNELQIYCNGLYDWLKKHNISYKPNDRKTLGVTVTALLLKDYKNIILQLNIKPRCVSKKNHLEKIQKIKEKAKHSNIKVILLNEEFFAEGLDALETKLKEIGSC